MSSRKCSIHRELLSNYVDEPTVPTRITRDCKRRNTVLSMALYQHINKSCMYYNTGASAYFEMIIDKAVGSTVG
jgi:hypothetical protein